MMNRAWFALCWAGPSMGFCASQVVESGFVTPPFEDQVCGTATTMARMGAADCGNPSRQFRLSDPARQFATDGAPPAGSTATKARHQVGRGRPWHQALSGNDKDDTRPMCLGSQYAAV